MIQILSPLLVFVLVWSLGVAGAALFVPAPWGPIAAAAMTGWLLWGYLLRPGEEGPEGRRALLRLRALDGGTLRETLVMIVPVLLFVAAASEVYLRLVPVPEQMMNPFAEQMETLRGRITIAVLGIGAAPVVEELFFRGVIQHRLERRLGAHRGIVLGAALFAAAHFLPWILPLHLLAGLTMGFAAYATRSIWSAVILHAANNTAALAGTFLATEESPAIRTVWQTGATGEWWLRVAGLLAAGALLAWSAQRLWRAGREARLRFA